MLRRPLGLSQATLARPSYCGHTLWSYIEVITHNAKVEIRKKPKKYIYHYPTVRLLGLPLINNMRVIEIKAYREINEKQL